jgi:hypothetical protein
MGVLQNQRWELFAQKIAAGDSTVRAYELAGFKRSRSNAARLRADERISARVLEIQQAAANRAEITLAGVLSELDQAIEIAKAKGQPNALVNAAQLRAKLGGLLVDKAEIAVTTEQYEPQSSAEVLADVMEKVGERAARALADAFGIEFDQAAIRALYDGPNGSQTSTRAIEWRPPRADPKRQIS